MPVTVSYPGVYIEEIPSGVRTITGVATSIAAFVGRARSGPVNDPVVINGFGDFERRFNGLGLGYPLSYAVRDFFLNGGSQAIIVRLFKGNTGTAKVAAGGLTLQAVSPGSWGGWLRATVALVTDTALKARFGLAPGDPLFDLTVRDSRPGGLTEQFRSLTTVKDNPRRADKVLEAESQLVRWDGDWPDTAPTPADGTDPVAKEEDKLKAAEKELRDEKNKGTTGDALKPFQDKVDTALKAVQDAVDDLGGKDSAALGNADYLGSEDQKTGFFALAKTDLFNILCIPPDTRDGDTAPAVYQAAMEYCVRRRAMLVVDPPAAWGKNKAEAAAKAKAGLETLGLTGTAARNAALYFPRVVESDPLSEGRLDTFVPCGAVAGVMARTDVQRGVWKAPAGLDAALNGVQALQVNLNDLENGLLNPLGINCLRFFPGGAGRVVWGARTLRGSDQLADEYKYVPVRRLALFIEESLYRGTQWVVFEPNDEPLWAQIRTNVGAFMNNLFRQGAFQGSSPREAYLVKCDKETTTQNDINLGIVNIVVGFAPLKPAEFVIIKIQQLAGQIET
jgi:phage tail sheath protein FI